MSSRSWGIPAANEAPERVSTSGIPGGSTRATSPSGSGACELVLQLGPGRLHFGLEVELAAVVLDHASGGLAPLRVAGLRSHATVHFVRIHVAHRDETLLDHVGIGNHGPEPARAAAPARLGHERSLDDDDGARVLADDVAHARGHLGPDERMDDAVEVGERLLVAEDDGAELGAVDVAVVADDVVAEALDDALEAEGARCIHLVRDAVRVDHV